MGEGTGVVLKERGNPLLMRWGGEIKEPGIDGMGKGRVVLKEMGNPILKRWGWRIQEPGVDGMGKLGGAGRG